MNYRHIYHAGNFADVFKHAVLIAALDHLRLKDKPFFALDTHAGIGFYPLNSAAALKTRESADGVEKIMAAAPRSDLLRAYQTRIRALAQNAQGLRLYPGSPALIRAMLRAGDRAVFNERHPEDSLALHQTFARDPQVRVEARDGYECVRALLPPPQKRGIVLIDPPFEVPDEFAQMVRALGQGLKRFATGIWMLWYPVKNPDTIAAFHAALSALPLPETLAATFFLRPPSDPKLFNGTGLVIVNPPWTLAGSLQEFLPELVSLLAPETGSWSLVPLSGAASKKP